MACGKVRKRFDAKEMQLFKSVLKEGQDKGVFHVDDVEMTAALVHYCVKGIEVPYIRGHIGANLDMETRKDMLPTSCLAHYIEQKLINNLNLVWDY